MNILKNIIFLLMINTASALYATISLENIKIIPESLREWTADIMQSSQKIGGIKFNVWEATHKAMVDAIAIDKAYQGSSYATQALGLLGAYLQKKDIKDVCFSNYANPKWVAKIFPGRKQLTDCPLPVLLNDLGKYHFGQNFEAGTSFLEALKLVRLKGRYNGWYGYVNRAIDFCKAYKEEIICSIALSAVVIGAFKIIDYIDYQDYSLFIENCRRGDLEWIKSWLSNNPMEVASYLCRNKQEALRVAAENGHNNIIDFLINNHGDVINLRHHDYIILFSALQHNKMHTADFILEKINPDDTTKTNIYSLFAQKNYSVACKYLLLTSTAVDVYKRLKDQENVIGTDENMRKNIANAAIGACIMNDIKKLKAFTLALSAVGLKDITKISTTEQKYSLLHIAVLLEYLDIISLLRSWKHSMCVMNKDNKNPLEFAEELDLHNKQDIIDLLLSFEGNPSHKSYHSRNKAVYLLNKKFNDVVAVNIMSFLGKKDIKDDVYCPCSFSGISGVYKF